MNVDFVESAAVMIQYVVLGYLFYRTFQLAKETDAAQPEETGGVSSPAPVEPVAAAPPPAEKAPPSGEPSPVVTIPADLQAPPPDVPPQDVSPMRADQQKVVKPPGTPV